MGYYDSYYDYDISPYARSIESSAASTGILAALGAFAMILMIIGIALAVLQIIGMWKLFGKAGEKGWKSIIPVYNMVISFKIAGLSPWLLFVYLAAFIPFIGWIASLGLTVYYANCLAKSFGKDVGYTFGLLLVPYVFYMILGFGSAQYVGPAGKSSSETTTKNSDTIETEKVEEKKDEE